MLLKLLGFSFILFAAKTREANITRRQANKTARLLLEKSRISLF